MDSEDIAPPFLTSILDGNDWSASGPGRLIPGERTPSTNRIGGWVGRTIIILISIITATIT
jgi:hypothetical protein